MLDASAGAAAAKNGHDVVVSQHEWLYFDYDYTRTPMRKTFVWYGTYDVEVRKEGYVTRVAGERHPHPTGDVSVTDTQVGIGKPERATRTR